MSLSYWEKDELCKPRSVLIIGAGIVGLSAAIKIKELKPTMSVIIIEAQPHGALASTRNAGFACYGSISEIVSDIEQYGEDQVAQLVIQRQVGIKYLKERYGSSINYTVTGGHEIFGDALDFERAQAQIDRVNRLVKSACFEATKSPDYIKMYEWAIYHQGEAQIHPVLLYQALEKEAISLGVSIYRSIAVDEQCTDQDPYTYLRYHSSA